MDWQQTIDQRHQESLEAINLARNGEEQENYEVALINYKLSLKLIDEALATPVAVPDDPEEIDDSWHHTLKTVQSLKRMRGELVHRIGQLAPSTSSNGEPSANTSSSAHPTNTSRPRTFVELAEALRNIETSDIENLPTVLELLFACDGVSLYHIKANGEVSTESAASTLRIIRLDQDIQQNLDATYFMQIIRTAAAETIQSDADNDGVVFNGVEPTESVQEEGAAALEHDFSNDVPAKKIRANTPPKSIDTSLVYPLVPGVSPCYRTDFGAFIFPDTQSNVPGAAYGLVVPMGADEIVLEILDSVLHGIVRQTGAEEGIEEAAEAYADAEGEHGRHKRHTSDRISENIVQGACILSNGLVKGTEQVGKLITYSTPYIISKLNKASNAPDPLPNKVTTGVGMARSATGVVSIFEKHF